MPDQLQIIESSWDEETDVLVFGFGGAGACAAIEAADAGARVSIIERFTGGGATLRSGGVIYAGTGTGAQKKAGFTDNVEKMQRYLFRESAGAVERGALRAFCRSSRDNLAWLEKLGVTIPAVYFPGKTTQPPDGYGLYFSGNEKQYADKDEPIPRGHVPGGAGMSGRLLYQALKRGIEERAITVRYRSRPAAIITGSDGSVRGAEIISLKDNIIVRLIHSLLFNLGFIIGSSRPVLARFEELFGTRSRVRARGGIIISTGGFIFNPEMVRDCAPGYSGTMPLGTPGDDGRGIRLGQAAGGALSSMDSCAASRFICPPEAFVSGILVNSRGERFCDESLYGATLSRHISRQPGRRAHLVIDRQLHREAREQMKREDRLRDESPARIFSGELNALIFRKITAFINLHVNRRKSKSLAGLARKCGIPPSGLTRAIEEYNQGCNSRGPDTFKKTEIYRKKIQEPPFYAIDCRLDSRLFPGPCLTLGGLRIEGATSQVLRDDGGKIPGLFAAGRSAAGICAGSYISGLSLADCIFSGRNAGREAARAAVKIIKK